MGELILVRHAETKEGNRFHEDPGLLPTARGDIAAKKRRLLLRGCSLEIIGSSPKKRAIHTAKALQTTKLEIITFEVLDEFEVEEYTRAELIHMAQGQQYPSEFIGIGQKILALPDGVYSVHGRGAVAAAAAATEEGLEIKFTECDGFLPRNLGDIAINR